ncbi:helix-turn-helix domain-containing protein [Nonomuraea sp. NPDC003560]|uniref:helix-turn-helix domain-containing protein n=1 Tax=Nonomuraea sp. NPDC003560 TaxID=3364341 RepID=UPI00368FEC7B
MTHPDPLATGLPGGLVLLGPVGVAYCERALRLAQRAAVRDGAASRPQVRRLAELLGAALEAIAAAAQDRASVSGSAEVPQDPPPPPSEAVGTEEAAELLGITARGVRDLCRRGTLPAVQVGGRWVIDRADLVAYADKRSRSGTMSHEYTNPPMREAARAHKPAPHPAPPVDGATPAKLRQALGLGADATDRQVRAAFDAQMRDLEGQRVIDAAILARKIPGARRDHYLDLWAADPDGTKSLLDELTPALTDRVEDERVRAAFWETAHTYDALFPGQA